MIQPLEWLDGKIRFLDQTLLPNREEYIETDDVQLIAEAIKRLAVRGAPLIGIAAAYGVALAALKLSSQSESEIRNRLTFTIEILASTRPTAVNLFWALDRQRKILNGWKSGLPKELQSGLTEEALKIHQEDREMCERISEYGAKLLPMGCFVLTHCNAGILATGGRGTALGIITKAWEAGTLRHVFMDETRPLLQGARLTAWELMKQKIPSTLITDNAAAFLMQQGKIHAVVVGADRIAANGDTANKIGTYNVAVLAKEHKIPFYVAAPWSTVDMQLSSGRQIPIEERNADEVRKIGNQQLSVEDVAVYSPAFDITPNEIITAIVTNRGVLKPPYVESIQSKQFENVD